MKEEKEQMEYKQNKTIELNFIYLIKRLITFKHKLYQSLLIGALIGSIIGLSTPKKYNVKVSLSPESNLSEGSNLMGIASMLKISNSPNINGDALSFNLLPEIIKSTPFLIEILNTNIRTIDNKNMVLYKYLDTEKSPWWVYLFKLPKQIINRAISNFTLKSPKEENKPTSAFKLTMEQQKHIDKLRSSLKTTINNKTNTTIISTTMQDPQVAAIIANIVVNKLQIYITEYRTRKAKQDYEFQLKLSEQYQIEYYKAQQDYAKFVDSNKNIILQSIEQEKALLKRKVQLTEQVYSQSIAQLQVLKRKIQEAKPVFTIVEPASIPLIPTGPRTLITIIGMGILFFFFESAWILFGNELMSDLKKI